jgi:hypothetical protein
MPRAARFCRASKLTIGEGPLDSRQKRAGMTLPSANLMTLTYHYRVQWNGKRLRLRRALYQKRAGKARSSTRTPTATHTLKLSRTQAATRIPTRAPWSTSTPKMVLTLFVSKLTARLSTQPGGWFGVRVNAALIGWFRGNIEPIPSFVPLQCDLAGVRIAWCVTVVTIRRARAERDREVAAG